MCIYICILGLCIGPGEAITYRDIARHKVVHKFVWCFVLHTYLGVSVGAQTYKLARIKGKLEMFWLGNTAVLTFSGINISLLYPLAVPGPGIPGQTCVYFCASDFTYFKPGCRIPCTQNFLSSGLMCKQKFSMWPCCKFEYIILPG